MNKKNLFLSFLAVALFMSAGIANAASVYDKYDNAMNKLQQVDSKVNESRNAQTNAKAEKTKNLQAQKNQALKPIKEQIKAKEKEIDDVTKSTILLQADKNIRLKKLNAELKILKNKETTTAAYYDKQINALK